MASAKKTPDIRARKSRAQISEASSVSSGPATNLSDRRNLQPRGLPPKGPYTASFSVAFLAFLLVRILAALYANIGDCDEVYNYWEPTHYLQYGYGMQTWEYSPEYSIRSWAYISPHAYLGMLISFLIRTDDKIKVFYGIRIIFAIFCAYCEAKFYRAVLDQLGNRVGRYIFVMLLSAAGMWNASIAFLPSTFSMYTTMLAFTFALGPVSSKNTKRPYRAIGFFGLGALLAWPFSAAVGIPLVFEELFVRGTETNKNLAKNINWRIQRIKRVAGATIYAFLIIIPIVSIDYIFYKKITIVPLNIILYNVFGGEGRGPNLYGTEPWSYYFVNGLLNFNILFVLAILSIPALALTFFVDNGRIASASPTDKNYPYIIVLLRLIPFYLWLFIFIAQPHKEERFLFVVYPLICLNAAVCLFLARGWVDRFLFELSCFSIARNRRKQFLTTLTSFILLSSVAISVSRVMALYSNYHAPILLYKHFYQVEIPTRNLSSLNSDKKINLCLGKEWHRFPSHYFLPHGVRLRFVQSDFRGLLPKYFLEKDDIVNDENLTQNSRVPIGTWKLPGGFNDRNKENPEHYDKNIDKCDYLIDLDFKSSESTPRETRYIKNTEEWSKIACLPFLDAKNSKQYARAFYLPMWFWEKWTKYSTHRSPLQWGDYCLLKKQPPKIKLPEYKEPESFEE
ncbi:11145_t:CDS:2, partial [Ambispora leptoticha]